MRPLKLEKLVDRSGDLFARRRADVRSACRPMGWVQSPARRIGAGAAVGWHRGKMIRIERRSRNARAQPEGVARGDVLPARADRRLQPAREACFGAGGNVSPRCCTDRSSASRSACSLCSASRCTCAPSGCSRRYAAAPDGKRALLRSAAEGARRSAPAALRNREPIAEVLAEWLPESGLVLEIASGTGEHAFIFAERFPTLEWQPSDVHPDALASIRAWRASAGLAERPRAGRRSTRRRPNGRSTAPTRCSASTWSTSVRGRRRWGCSTVLRACLDPERPLILYGPWLKR